MKRLIVCLLSLGLLFGCTESAEPIKDMDNKEETNINQEEKPSEGNEKESIIDVDGKTLVDRIKTPKGYTRTDVDTQSFGYYLRNIGLKPQGHKVRYYDGSIKARNVYEAVLDIDVGSRDLQQCADSIIRLRAEYLYKHKKYSEISFNLTNGFNVPYTKWADGYRVKVSGNTTSWVKKFSQTNYEYDNFRDYLTFIYTYAGTLSLSQELNKVPYNELSIGDVFIQGGSPGHAVIVMDTAKNKDGEVVYLLAQGYMPAQEMHILKSPNGDTNPWYKLNNGSYINTPEWRFTREDLKGF